LSDDGNHSLTTTDTVSGKTSAASSAATITVDTHASSLPPGGPIFSSPSGIVQIDNNYFIGQGQELEFNGAAVTVGEFPGWTPVASVQVAGGGFDIAWENSSDQFTFLAADSHANLASSPINGVAFAANSATVEQQETIFKQDLNGDGTIGVPATSPTQPSQPTPNAPVITSGNHTTNDNTVTVTGTAVAGSIVTVFDGTTKLGTTTVGSNGSWNFTTAALNDGNHSLTATDTVSGKTSAASSAEKITVDTHAPDAPVLVSDSVVNTDQVKVTGTAEANSSITVFDGTTAIGTATTGSNGAWSLTTGALNNGSHVLTATATDAAGNVSGHSQALDAVIGATTPPTSGLSGVVQINNNYFIGQGHELQFHGAAVTVGEFQGWTPIAAVQVAGGSYDVAWKNSSGQFAFTLTDSHGNLTSSPADHVALAGNGGAIEKYEGTIFHQDLNGDGTIGVPTTPTTSGLSGVVQINNNYFIGQDQELQFHGAAVTVGEFQGWTPIAAVQVAGGSFDVAWKNSSGQFAFTLTDSHGNLTSSPADHVALAGNGGAIEKYEGTIFHQDLNGDGTIGVPGSSNSPVLPSNPGHAAAVSITDPADSSKGLVTIKGTADPFSQIKLFDGTAAVGTVKAAADGTGSHTSSAAVSNTVHTHTAQELDSSGHVAATSGSAILGSSGANMLTSAGNNLFVGNGHPDTFVFASNFGNDVIKDFNANASSPGHDVVQFSKSVFDSFADVLAHATQSGQNVVITHGADSLTLNNVKLAALDKHDFHFA
jgi:hypothetical protein